MFGEIASGGMATVYFGRSAGAVGFSRSVAIKQLHPQYAKSPEFVAQFLDEAKLTARIRHPNVVSVLDVVARDGELFVVMEYVEGEPLSRLAYCASDPVPLAVASAILVQVLLGLHAAHEATTEAGVPLQIVHRDVSPQNMLVGLDGASHILDFGVAKAVSRLHTTENGQIKGKLSYMAPEQLRAEEVDRRADIFAAGVVLWELLTKRRLFWRSDPYATVTAVLADDVKAPSEYRAEVPTALDSLVLKALASDPQTRFATAREMAIALELCVPPAGSLAVGGWVESVAGDSIKERARCLREVEESTGLHEGVDPGPLLQHAGRGARMSDEGSLAGATTQPLIQGTRSPLNIRQRLLIRGAALMFGLLGLASVMALGHSRQSANLHQLAAPTSPASPSVFTNAVPVEPKILLPTDLPLEGAVLSLGNGAAPRLAKKTPHKRLNTANCKPPYEFDSERRKRFKPECF